MLKSLLSYLRKLRLTRYVRYYEHMAELEGVHLSNAISTHTERRIAALNMAARCRAELSQ